MAIITIDRIDPLGAGQVRVTFTGTGSVYVDGVLETPIPVTDTVDLSVRDQFSIEIHDEETTPAIVARKVRPTISWRPVPGETPAEYRVYIQPSGEAEALVYIQPFEEDTAIYSILAPDELPSGWAFIRVESADDYGNETTVDAWPILCHDLPGAATDITVTGAGGVFDFAVT
jgi:hypothetical protein